MGASPARARGRWRRRRQVSEWTGAGASRGDRAHPGGCGGCCPGPRATARIHEDHVIEASPGAHERGGFAGALAHLERAIVSAPELAGDGCAGSVVAPLGVADADHEATTTRAERGVDPGHGRCAGAGPGRAPVPAESSSPGETEAPRNERVPSPLPQVELQEVRRAGDAGVVVADRLLALPRAARRPAGRASCGTKRRRSSSMRLLVLRRRRDDLRVQDRARRRRCGSGGRGCRAAPRCSRSPVAGARRRPSTAGASGGS